MTHHYALKGLLTILLDDIGSTTSPDFTKSDIGIYVIGPWRGLDAVWIQQNAVTFWLDKTIHAEARVSNLPTELADHVRAIWLEVSQEYADVETIRRKVSEAD